MSKSTHKKETENMFDKIDRLSERTDAVLSKVTNNLEDSVEEYTARELEYLDRFKEITGDAMDDEEIYDIIIKHNFDNSKIRKEIDEMMKLVLKKGEEYGWTKIEKGKKAKIEKKEPEVKIKQRSDKFTKYNNKPKTSYTKNKDYKYNKGQYKTETNEEKTTEEVEHTEEVQNVDEGVQVEPEYIRKNYYYNNNYNSYGNYNRGRGRGGSYYRGGSNRGYASRGAFRGSRGNGRYKKNFYGTREDMLFEIELNGNKKEIGIDGKSEDLKEYPSEPIHQEEVKPVEKLIEQDQHSPKKEETHFAQIQHKPIHHVSHNLSHEKVHKKSHHEDDSNLFNSKEINNIPSNIRSNINNLFDESESTNESKGFSIHNKYAENNNRRFNEEFTVSSSSMSIGNTNSTKINQVNPQKVVAQPQNVSVNTPFQSASFTQHGQNKISSTSPSINSNKNNSQNMQQTYNKKNEVSTGTTPEYHNAFMPPWMGQMGYFPQQGMNYDPNQMGNSPMYPMMPFYMFPGFGYQTPEMEDPMMKGKKNNLNGQNNQNTNEMNSQQNPNMYQGFTPFYYYNPQNPYSHSQMGMPPMGMIPGMNMGVNPNMPMDPQNFGAFDIKNMKNTGDEQNQNMYYGFYKQG